MLLSTIHGLMFVLRTAATPHHSRSRRANGTQQAHLVDEQLHYLPEADGQWQSQATTTGFPHVKEDDRPTQERPQALFAPLLHKKAALDFRAMATTNDDISMKWLGGVQGQ